MDRLTDGPAAGAIWRVELGVRQTVDGSANVFGQIGNVLDIFGTMLPADGRFVELADWVTEVLYRFTHLSIAARPLAAPTTPAFGHPSSGRRGAGGSDLIAAVVVFEACKFFQKCKTNVAGRAVALFGY